MARKRKPPKNAELDKRIAEREAQLAAYVNRYNDILDKRAVLYAAEIAPFWQRAGKVIGEEMAKIVAEMVDANGVPIRRQPIQPAKYRNMQRALEHLGQLLRYVREAEQPDKMTNNLVYTYTDSYYFSAFGLQEAAQLAIHTPVITHAQVLGVLANPWLPDGRTYSDRQRMNTAYLGLKMRESVEEAVQKGWDTNRIARRIQDIAGEGYFNSVRLARTEMNRAAGQGASHLFMQNADLLDGKRWNATLDARTSPKCAVCDGLVFDLAYDTPEMPGEPGQRIPNHPNCRCKWSPVLASLGVREGERIARGDGDTETEFGDRIYTKARNYREYAKARGIDLDERLRNDDPRRYLRQDERGTGPSPVPIITGAAAGVTAAAATVTWADTVKQQIAQGVETEDQARAVGSQVRQEVERAISETAPALELRASELKDEADGLYEELRDIVNGIWQLDRSSPEFKAGDERIKKLKADLEAKRKEYNEAMAAVKDVRANATVAKLAEIRPMGSSKSHQWVSGSQTKAKDAIARAQRFYPTEWLEQSQANNPLDAKVVKRGYYRGVTGYGYSELKISGTNDAQLTRVAIHELGHRFEHMRPEIKRLEHQFYARRTAGESLQHLGPGYGANEKTRFDKFLSPYMGKDYGNKETSYFEIFTMGAESVFTGSYPIQTDEDYYDFILGVLATK